MPRHPLAGFGGKGHAEIFRRVLGLANSSESGEERGGGSSWYMMLHSVALATLVLPLPGSGLDLLIF